MAQGAASGQADLTLGPLDTLVGYHMRRATAVIDADFARVMAGTGVRQVLFGILSVVATNPGINQGAAGRMLGIQRANMVSLITELTSAGWLDRQSTPGDRRAFSLIVTEEGKTIMTRCLRRMRAHEERLLAAMTADERGTLVELLRRIEVLEG